MVIFFLLTSFFFILKVFIGQEYFISHQIDIYVFRKINRDSFSTSVFLFIYLLFKKLLGWNLYQKKAMYIVKSNLENDNDFFYKVWGIL